MKRLILAPLLIASLLISDSALATRNKLKKQKQNLYLENLINECNSSPWKPEKYCDKINGDNRNLITNKIYLKAKIEQAQTDFDSCMKSNDDYECYELANNLDKLFWLKDKISPKDIKIILRRKQWYEKKIGKSNRCDNDCQQRKYMECLKNPLHTKDSCWYKLGDF